ncbi:MAG: hypothetical protein EBZ36_18460 [Acidobacteria bacterium]|nr:hypothetical protein [Acidobacteriota bacterium]
MGFPVFCKPNLGAKGNFAEIVSSADGLSDYTTRLSKEFEAFLIEPVLVGSEHRVFLQDGDVVFHSCKSQPALTGDGTSSLIALLEKLNVELSRQGVSAYPTSTLSLTGRPADWIPAFGERISLPGRRNLSASGSVEQVSETGPPALVEIARKAARTIGLRIAAVDLFDISPSGDLSGIVIIEVNGNPGLKTLEMAGRMDLVTRVWTRMLTELLEI